jgi:hypothetical protein
MFARCIHFFGLRRTDQELFATNRGESSRDHGYGSAEYRYEVKHLDQEIDPSVYDYPSRFDSIYWHVRSNLCDLVVQPTKTRTRER